MTACNQKCYFCPVSIAPREDYTMPTEFFEQVVNQLTDYRSSDRECISAELQRADVGSSIRRSVPHPLCGGSAGRGAEQRTGLTAGQSRCIGRIRTAALHLHQPVDAGPGALSRRSGRRSCGAGASQSRLRRSTGSCGFHGHRGPRHRRRRASEGLRGDPRSALPARDSTCSRMW